MSNKIIFKKSMSKQCFYYVTLTNFAEYVDLACPYLQETFLSSLLCDLRHIPIYVASIFIFIFCIIWHVSSKICYAHLKQFQKVRNTDQYFDNIFPRYSLRMPCWLICSRQVSFLNTSQRLLKCNFCNRER